MATFFSRANDALSTPSNDSDNTIYIFIGILVVLIVLRD